MKKKIFSFIVALALIFTSTMCLAACGGKKPTPAATPVDPTGKTFVFADLKLLHIDGSELTAEELAEDPEDAVGNTEVFKALNLGLRDEDGEPVENGTARTLNCELNKNLSGTCEFGGGELSEMATPYRYSYDASRQYTVEVYSINDEDSTEEIMMKGNLVRDTLTLTAPINAEYNWVFIFKLTGTI